MEWWRGVLIGVAVAAFTAGVGAVVCKKAFALGFAVAAIICSKLSTPAATWFGKKWLVPVMENFMAGYKARCDQEPEAELEGVTAVEEGSPRSGQAQRRKLWDRLGIRRRKP